MPTCHYAGCKKVYELEKAFIVVEGMKFYNITHEWIINVFKKKIIAERKKKHEYDLQSNKLIKTISLKSE